MLEIQDLHVKFHNRDREAVSGVSLTIQDGEILGLVGESGSGKSVTAMSVAGLLPRKQCDYTGRHREVHNATTAERAAVGDFHDDFLAVLLVAHFEQRAERQRAVGAGEAILMVARTVARVASVEFVAIIGCVAVQALRTGGKYCEKCDYCCKNKNRL